MKHRRGYCADIIEVDTVLLLHDSYTKIHKSRNPLINLFRLLKELDRQIEEEMKIADINNP